VGCTRPKYYLLKACDTLRVVAKDWVVTNCHVVHEGTQLCVQRDEGRVTARVIDRASDQDLCLLDAATRDAPIIPV
jgi:S1-C subfamily serine protease